MGQSQPPTEIRTVTLNYFGIYLNPFQFYGVDNWQELQRIGRIFESQLKKSYRDIMEYRYELSKQKGPEQYSRKGFKWNVGDIDKAIHSQRYTPLYASSDNIKHQRFAGLHSSHQRLMNKKEFQAKWKETFNSLPPKKDKPDKDYQKGVRASEVEKINCMELDFLCYKSIILYLYTKHNDDGSYSYKDNFQHQFQKILQNNDNHSKYVPLYIDFMKDYFKRIDQQGKIKITLECLFQRSNSPQIFSFTEGTQRLRSELQKLDDYYIFGFDKADTKQTILMVKKNLYFIPQNYSVPSVPDLKEIKRRIGEQLKVYQKDYLQFWNNQLKQLDQKDKKVKAKKEFFQKLQQDFMHWSEDTTIVMFQEQKIMIGAFHLSSKQETNPLQIQLLGLIIHHWEKQGYKFIFSGDFNSYVTISEKEPLNLFAFVNYFEQKTSKDYIKQQTGTVDIFPKHPKIITSKKKRTILQPQFHKMNQLAQKCIDQVITNFTIKHEPSHVGEIADLGKQNNNNNSFLPHKEHPYDHLLVEAFIDLKVNARK